VNGRRRSDVTLPGYRLGMKPANAGKKYPAEVLTRDEILALMAACSRRGNAGPRNKALIATLWRSGLRIDEALELRPKDIDLDEGTIAILSGKGARRRVVGIDADAGDAVELWLRLRRELGVGPKRPVFCVISWPNVGGLQHSSVVRETLKDLGVKAGLEKRIHPHGFRHTYAVELSREGVPVDLIRKLLGHSSLATTVRYLDHLEPVEAIRAIHNRPRWAELDELDDAA
jgi:integrase